MKNREHPKLCLYIGSLRKGGAEHVIANLADYFFRRGWRVTLVTTYFDPPEYTLPEGDWDPETGIVRTDPEGRHVHRIYSDPAPEDLQGSRLHNFRVRADTLRQIWKDEKPDVILSFIGSNNVMSILTTRGLNIPVAISVRADPAEEYEQAKTRIPAMMLFHQADLVILQTNGAKAFFPKAVQEKSIILPNSIQPDFIRPRFAGTRTKRVVMVGRLDENKSQSLVIRAFADVLKRNETLSSWVLDLYGDGPARKDCEDLTKELSLSDHVLFEGVQEGIAEKIQDAGVFVIASKREGMPNALIEAMSLGLACISTDSTPGAPRDLIRNGENGILVPADDEKAMADALEDLMTDPDRCEKLGKEAIRIQESQNPGRVNALWEKALRSILR